MTLYRNEGVQNQVEYRKTQECSPSISGSVYDIYTRELLVGSLVELLNQEIDSIINLNNLENFHPKVGLILFKIISFVFTGL